MLDLDQIQIIAQLADNMEIISSKIEKAFESNDGEEFAQSKKELIESQKKINSILNPK